MWTRPRAYIDKQRYQILPLGGEEQFYSRQSPVILNFTGTLQPSMISN